MGKSLLEKKVDKLITILEEKQSVVTNGNGNGGEYVPIVGRDGLPSKIDKNKLFQTVYSDIDELKVNFSAILEKVSEIEKSTKEIPDIKLNIEQIRVDMPQTFRSWLSARADLARGFIAILKLGFYIIVTFYIASQSIPVLAVFFKKMIE